MKSSFHTNRFSCDSLLASVGEPCSDIQDQFLLHTRHFPRGTEQSHSPMDPQPTEKQEKTSQIL